MNSCRSCTAALGAPFLSLGASPLSNAYLTGAQLSAMEATYPLDVFLCEQCFLVQIDELARADGIFGEDYAYFSSFSESWLAHCRGYTDTIVARYALGPQSHVVEVGSNDGYLLQYFQERSIPVLGIEPSASVARAAIAKGIPTEVVFFDAAYADRLRAAAPPVDLLIANNVLAHNPNLNDFVAGIARVLAPRGVATLELPHLLRMLEGTQFDTIYHEHYSYFSLHAVEALFERHGLVVFDVEQLTTHGGSLRVHAQLAATGPWQIAEQVEAVRVLERRSGLLSPQTYALFRERVVQTKHALLTLLIEAKRAGMRVVGYGAPAKGNTLLNYCGIRTDLIAYTVDLSPHKQGRYLPGTRIPIHAPEQIFVDKPDLVLLLAWNLRDEIVAQLGGIAEWGGRFVVPIPIPSVLP